jgi:hypothetical protein
MIARGNAMPSARNKTTTSPPQSHAKSQIPVFEKVFVPASPPDVRRGFASPFTLPGDATRGAAARSIG